MSELDINLIARVEAALAMADAHRQQARAPELVLWRTVQHSWEFAGEKVEAIKSGGSDLRDYCKASEKQAYKQAAFEEAALENNYEKAEEILYALCRDDFLRRVSDVWFKHADHCLVSVIKWMERNAENMPVSNFLEKSRDSLARVHAQNLDKDEQSRYLTLSVDWIAWSQFVVSDEEIAFALEQPEQLLTVDACKRALDEFNRFSAHKNLTHKARALYKQRWQYHKRLARQKLEHQRKQSKTPLEQIENLVALDVLFPNEKFASQIERVLRRPVRELEDDVGRLLGDDSGQRTVLFQRHKSDDAIDESKVAHLQMKLVASLVEQAETLQLAIQRSEKSNAPAQQHDSQHVEKSPLSKKLYLVTQNASEWQTNVMTLATKLDEVDRLIEEGLVDPQLLDEAEDILRIGQAQGYGSYAPIAENFTNNNHISVLHYRDEARRNRSRRKSQEELFRQISDLLHREADLVGSVTALQSRQDHQISERLMTQLNRCVKGLREAQRLLNQMRREEPDDACRLQEQLEYSPADVNEGAFYQGLKNILPIIDAKLAQYTKVEQWVEKHRGMQWCVSWHAAQQEIEQLREFGQLSLVASREFLNAVVGQDGFELYTASWLDLDRFDSIKSSRGRNGTIAAAWQKAGEYEGKSTLQYAARKLSYEQMVMGIEPSESMYAITQQLNYERQRLHNQIKEMLIQADELAKNINWRLEQYRMRWGKFEMSVVDLRNSGGGWRRFFFGQGTNLTRRDEWYRFVEARNKFCEICPEDANFIEMLRDLSYDLDLSMDVLGCQSDD